MSARLLLFVFGLLLIIAPLKAGAVEVSGPARIIDGDTLVIGETIIRLHGIDATETGQLFVGEGHRILWLGKGAVLLRHLLMGGVSCDGPQWEACGRIVAVCPSLKGEEINRRFISDSWARAFVKHNSDCAQASQRQGDNPNDFEFRP